MFGKTYRDRDTLPAVELLLRAAAEDAGEAPDEGLAARALHRWKARQARRRKATLAAALVGLGALTVALVGHGEWPRLATAPIASAPADVGFPAGALSPAADRPIPHTNTGSVKPAASKPGSTEAGTGTSRRDSGVRPPPESRRPSRRPRRAATTRLAAVAPGPRRTTRGPLRARWEVRDVHHEVAGVLAPVWLVQADDERGELRLGPGLVEIPLAALAYDDTSNLPAEPGDSSGTPTAEDH